MYNFRGSGGRTQRLTGCAGRAAGDLGRLGGEGRLTRINDTLTNLMEAERRARSGE